MLNTLQKTIDQKNKKHSRKTPELTRSKKHNQLTSRELLSNDRLASSVASHGLVRLSLS